MLQDPGNLVTQQNEKKHQKRDVKICQASYPNFGPCHANPHILPLVPTFTTKSL